jgi:Novel STAND NTPase 1
MTGASCCCVPAPVRCTSWRCAWSSSRAATPARSTRSRRPWRAGASTLSDRVDLWLAGTPSRLLLVVDQFEEVFT